VHELLRYLETIDFPAPRVVDTDGSMEVLTWLDGESGAAGWANVVPEEGLRSWARFLRRYHDAVAGFRPSAKSTWSSGPGACGAGEIVCHGDFGPWNGIWVDGEVVGLIDWDHARPAPAMFDVAYALEYVAPFRSDEECVQQMRYSRAPDRRRRIEVFCDAYGMEVPDDVVSVVADQQALTNGLVEQLGARGIEPQATWVRDGHLKELRERVAWTRRVVL